MNSVIPLLATYQCCWLSFLPLATRIFRLIKAFFWIKIIQYAWRFINFPLDNCIFLLFQFISVQFSSFGNLVHIKRLFVTTQQTIRFDIHLRMIWNQSPISNVKRLKMIWYWFENYSFLNKKGSLIFIWEYG